MSFFLSLFHYPLTHLFFIWAQIEGAGKASGYGHDGVRWGWARRILLDYYCWVIDACRQCACVIGCNLKLIVMCVYAGAFLHACVWKNKWVIKLHQGCLPSHNKCTQIFGTLWHQPPTLTHTFTHSSSQCDELSVPVRLGILVSTRFGSPFRGAELRTFSPLSIPESSEQEGKKTDRKWEPRISHDIGEFVFNHLLKYLPWCMSFIILTECNRFKAHRHAASNNCVFI